MSHKSEPRFYDNDTLSKKLKKTDARVPGSFMTIHTSIESREVGMVLFHITKNELRRYLKDHHISYDSNSEVWKTNYSLVGHYKADDLREKLEDPEELLEGTPAPLNLLVMRVTSKTDYAIVVPNHSEVQKLFDVIKEISQADKRIPDLLNELYKMSMMSVVMNNVAKNHNSVESEVSEVESDE